MKTAICLLLLSSIAAYSEPITLPSEIVVDGVNFSEVSYQSHDQGKVKFSHSSGVSSIPTEKMPENVRELLGFDPDAARVALEKSEEERIQNAKDIAAKRAAASAMLVEHDAARRESMSLKSGSDLRAAIDSAESEYKKIYREYSESVAQYADRKTKSTTYEFDNGQVMEVSRELKNSRKIGGGGKWNTPENTARRARMTELEEFIASAKKKLSEIKE